MRRSLSLKRETLADLTPGELAGIQGGSHVDCTVTHGASFDESCPTPTLPVNFCIDGLTDRGCLTISPDMCVWTR
jgi:hypothetical protein